MKGFDWIILEGKLIKDGNNINDLVKELIVQVVENSLEDELEDKLYLLTQQRTLVIFNESGIIKEKVRTLIELRPMPEVEVWTKYGIGNVK